MKLRFEKPDIVILSTQRSGTHFLASALASHPRMHNRGESVVFLMRRDGSWKAGISRPFWQQCLFKMRVQYLAATKYKWAFINKPGHVNVTTVMYSQLAYFEEICGSIMSFKTIHLLRDPRAVALSFAQLKANRAQFGKKYPSHLTIDQDLLPQALPSADQVNKIEHKTRLEQQQYSQSLEQHPNLFTIHYETITNGSQVSEIKGNISESLLAFCGLDYFTLTTNLRKVGTATN